MNLDLDIGNLFWRKKSTTLKKTNGFLGCDSRAVRGNTCGDI